MIPKPTQRRRKRLLPILVITLLLLCAIPTLLLTVVRGNKAWALWLGDQVYVLQTHTPFASRQIELIDVYKDLRGDDNENILSLGFAPTSSKIVCSGIGRTLKLAELELEIFECTP